MVIVSNIYEVAFRSYSSFSNEMYKTVSSRVYQYKNLCYTHLEKYMLPATQNSYGFLTALKVFAVLY